MLRLCRVLVVGLLALSPLAVAACDNSDAGTDQPTPTSGDVPHNNPSGGETGTDGTDTGSR